MSHASLLLMGPSSDLAGLLDEDGQLADPLASFTAYDCPEHGEFSRPDYSEDQGCPKCKRPGTAI